MLYSQPISLEKVLSIKRVCFSPLLFPLKVFIDSRKSFSGDCGKCHKNYRAHLCLWLIGLRSSIIALLFVIRAFTERRGKCLMLKHEVQTIFASFHTLEYLGVKISPRTTLFIDWFLVESRTIVGYSSCEEIRRVSCLDIQYIASTSTTQANEIEIHRTNPLSSVFCID